MVAEAGHIQDPAHRSLAVETASMSNRAEKMPLDGAT